VTNDRQIGAACNQDRRFVPDGRITIGCSSRAGDADDVVPVKSVAKSKPVCARTGSQLNREALCRRPFVLCHCQRA
jgi:hypothetical protein